MSEISRIKISTPEYDEILGNLNIIIRKGPEGINVIKSDKDKMPDDLSDYVAKEAV